jgi:hypothetical protein
MFGSLWKILILRIGIRIEPKQVAKIGTRFIDNTLSRGFATLIVF